MRTRDFKEILQWTFLSGVLTFIALGARTASGGDEVGKAVVPVVVTRDGLEYKLDRTADLKASVVTGTLTVTSKAAAEAKLDIVIETVNQTFKGNPASRAFNPRDFSETVVAEKDATLKVPGSGTRSVKFRLKFDQPTPKRGEPMTTAMIAVSVGGKRILMASAVPTVFSVSK